MLGIAAETTKKERLISDEITMNRQEDSVSLNSRLMERTALCNLMNERYGLDMSVNLSQTPIDTSALLGLDDDEDDPDYTDNED